VGRTLAAPLACLAAAALVATALAGEAADRLDRFRHLAATRLALAEILEPDDPGDAYREAWALLDDEVVDNLSSGGVFATTAFLQDRLDAFSEAWGGAGIGVARLGPLLVGSFELGAAPGAQSVRVYGGLGAEPALLTTLVRDGRPALFTLPPPAAGGLLLVWEGRPSGDGVRPVRFELLRPTRDGVRIAWSTADLFPEGLHARVWSVRGAEIRVRYEVRYPGWTLGCEGQMDQEDVYRPAPGGTTFVRTARALHNGWHRDVHAAAARVFDALARRDAAALARAVPDAGLRARLPASLRREPACDATDDGGRDVVSLAATTASGRPWSLTFRRSGPGWRLSAAAPVLQ